MKKSHLLALVVIAIAVFMIISTVGDASVYVAFSDARNLANEGSGKLVHVVGELPKGPDGKPAGMRYDPKVDPNSFSFMMIDSLNQSELVIYNQPKPQDMDKTEKVVVVGKMNLKKNYFEAEQILLKCPSKYNNNTLQTEVAKL
jgi:cytochrome c-type biogenesis protein CcmE